MYSVLLSLVLVLTAHLANLVVAHSTASSPSSTTTLAASGPFANESIFGPYGNGSETPNGLACGECNIFFFPYLRVWNDSNPDGTYDNVTVATAYVTIDDATNATLTSSLSPVNTSFPCNDPAINGCVLFEPDSLPVSTYKISAGPSGIKFTQVVTSPTAFIYWGAYSLQGAYPTTNAAGSTYCNSTTIASNFVIVPFTSVTTYPFSDIPAPYTGTIPFPASSFEDIPFPTAQAENFLAQFPNMNAFSYCTPLRYYGAPQYASPVLQLTHTNIVRQAAVSTTTEVTTTVVVSTAVPSMPAPQTSTPVVVTPSLTGTRVPVQSPVSQTVSTVAAGPSTTPTASSPPTSVQSSVPPLAPSSPLSVSAASSPPTSVQPSVSPLAPSSPLSVSAASSPPTSVQPSVPPLAPSSPSSVSAAIVSVPTSFSPSAMPSAPTSASSNSESTSPALSGTTLSVTVVGGSTIEVTVVVGETVRGGTTVGGSVVGGTTVGETVLVGGTVVGGTTIGDTVIGGTFITGTAITEPTASGTQPGGPGASLTTGESIATFIISPFKPGNSIAGSFRPALLRAVCGVIIIVLL